MILIWGLKTLRTLYPEVHWFRATSPENQLLYNTLTRLNGKLIVVCLTCSEFKPPSACFSNDPRRWNRHSRQRVIATGKIVISWTTKQALSLSKMKLKGVLSYWLVRSSLEFGKGQHLNRAKFLSSQCTNGISIRTVLVSHFSHWEERFRCSQVKTLLSVEGLSIDSFMKGCLGRKREDGLRW